MTDKEKKKLLEAFDIPDPDRKKQFSDEYRKRRPEKIKKPIFPLIMRTVASAAMLALVIGAITRIPKPDTDMFNDDNIIETTTAATSIEASAQTTADNSAAVTTTAMGKDKSKTTTASKAVSTDPAKTNDDNSTVTAEADDPENNEPEPTEHTQKPARTTKTPSVRITTTRESQHHLTTTKPAPQPQTTTVTTSSKNTMSVMRYLQLKHFHQATASAGTAMTTKTAPISLLTRKYAICSVTQMQLYLQKSTK